MCEYCWKYNGDGIEDTDGFDYYSCELMNDKHLREYGQYSSFDNQVDPEDCTEYLCEKCLFNKEEETMPKLIRNWNELFALPPNDKYKIVPDKDGYPCGWISPIVETPETLGNEFFKHHVYLSTHTFYGRTHEYSTRKLKEYGFDVEIDNWDKEEK